jgi:adenylate cyclase
MKFFKELISAFLRGELADHLTTLVAPKLGIFARLYKDPVHAATAVVFLLVLAFVSLAPGLQSELKSKTLDLALSWRLASPIPDKRIVILDIDEKSLAMLAAEHGRWPWSRALMAEALATLSEFAPRSILLNIMYSDSDIRDKDGDETFEQVASLLSEVTYPMVRLSKENDSRSQISAGMLKNAVITNPDSVNKTVAVLIPIFPSTHDKLGLINLKPDRDSVIRSYPLLWQEEGFLLKSAALLSAMKDPTYKEPGRNSITLNWRNKSGSYKRISFADFLDASKAGDLDLKMLLKDAHVIVGVSAPGISILKSTPVSPLVDDNEVLATAIDDLVNDTHLRLLPVWFTSILTAVLICAVVFALRKGVNEKAVGRWFTAGQFVMVAATVISASYTNFLLDLSDTLVFVTLFFSIVKLSLLLERNTLRGSPKYIDISGVLNGAQSIITVGIAFAKKDKSKLRDVKLFLEEMLGPKNTFIVDNAFSKENIFGKRFSDFVFFLNVIPQEKAIVFDQKINRFLEDLNVDHATSMVELSNVERTAYEDEVSERLIVVTNELLSKQKRGVVNPAT